jgi:hypothetical protein
MAVARLGQIGLPDFGMPDACPVIPERIYGSRFEMLRRRLEIGGYDRVVLYADREHSAGIAYLTGFDPRFEEAILVVGPADEPAILVGNECIGIAAQAPLRMRTILFQDMSLQGQPRDRSAPLSEILADEGIAPGARVGVIGSKTYARPAAIDAPSYLVDELRRSVGPTGCVENASGILNDAADGLRAINEVEQLASFEYSACQTSDGIRRLLFGLIPGMSEREAVRLLRWNGMPLSCHLMLSAGPRASSGDAQPQRSADRARRPVHRRFWSVGRVELPRRASSPPVRASCRRASATTSAGWSGRTSRRSRSGTAPCTSARPAVCCRRSSTGVSATRSSASS